MKIAKICAAFLIALPVAPAAQQSERPQMREHHWVNPLPDNAHERVRHNTYHSAAMDVDVGYAIYLPPGYEESANAEWRYPVVYFLPGGVTGHESRMLYPGRVDMASLIHARIQSGVVDPRIYVFVNGGTLGHYDYRGALGETTFVHELIPHIDTQYRTIANRAGRGIEGFSSGGRGTARNMFKYPQLFCSAVPLSGGHQHEKAAAENDGHLTGRTAGFVVDPGDNSWDLAKKYAAQGNNARLEILVVVGTDDMNYKGNLEWMDHLESLGIAFERRIVPDTPHNPRMIYEKAGDAIMSFHERCFCSAGN